jgi:hypothetical protein
VLGYIFGCYVANCVTGDALGIKRANEAAVKKVELKRIVLPQDMESVRSRHGNASLSYPSGMIDVVDQVVVDISDVLAEPILAKLSWVVDVQGADHASAGRGP